METTIICRLKSLSSDYNEICRQHLPEAFNKNPRQPTKDIDELIKLLKQTRQTFSTLAEAICQLGRSQSKAKHSLVQRLSLLAKLYDETYGGDIWQQCQFPPEDVNLDSRDSRIAFIVQHCNENDAKPQKEQIEINKDYLADKLWVSVDTIKEDLGEYRKDAGKAGQHGIPQSDSYEYLQAKFTLDELFALLHLLRDEIVAKHQDRVHFCSLFQKIKADINSTYAQIRLALYLDDDAFTVCSNLVDADPLLHMLHVKDGWRKLAESEEHLRNWFRSYQKQNKDIYDFRIVVNGVESEPILTPDSPVFTHEEDHLLPLGESSEPIYLKSIESAYVRKRGRFDP